MKKRKPFYTIGELIQIRTSGCQTEDNYYNKIALVLKVFEQYQTKGKPQPHYELKVLNYTGTSDWVNPDWDHPYKEINGDPSHIIIRQSDLQRMKKQKTEDK